MKKAGNTYSDRSRRRADRPVKSPRKASRRMPAWTVYAAAITLTVVLCLTINFRAFTELKSETKQNESLNAEIEKVTSENLNLQEEIYYLQNDSNVIEREARKFGFKRQNQEKKVSVPANK